tara:strand:+ start:48 stop:287 length:240 start_codon:yes stop_codon:yes gene_type:complete
MTKQSKNDILTNVLVLIFSLISLCLVIYYFCIKANRNRPIIIPQPPPYRIIFNEISPRYENEEGKPPDYEEINIIISDI